MNQVLHWPGPGTKVTGSFLRLISRDCEILTMLGLLNLESIIFFS